MMFEKLKAILLYANATPREWAFIKPEIHRSNRTRLTVFSAVAAVFLLVMVLLTLPMPQYDSTNYLLPLMFCLAMLAGARLAGNRPVLLDHLVVIFIAMLFAFAINVSTLSNPTQTAGTFLAFLLAIPLLMILRPIENIGLIVLFEAVFSVAVLLVKDNPSIRYTDIVNGVIFAGVSMIISTYMTCITVENFVIKDRMTHLASFDQLTRLQNRNAYELSLPGYPARAAASLSCIYLDANGLHELNNQKGHDAGDLMLQTVATALSGQFGSGDSFRVGGDEFIAFAADVSPAELDKKIAALRRSVEKSGYHVSLGVSTQRVDSLDMYTLVKTAEKAMYQDKSEFYAATGRTGR